MMNIPFFYEVYTDAHHLTLSDANMHYLLNVLRMQTNELIYITNGNGQKALVKLVNVSKRHCDLQILETQMEEIRKPSLHLTIAFTKNNARMEWLLEKITELGIASITPLITQRSEKSFFKKDRFEKILIAAMLQSQQTYLPILHPETKLASLFPSKAAQNYIAYCGNEFEKFPLLTLMKKEEDTLFLIGPEGDFTADEVHLCKQHHCDVIQLGSNRLRTETAGLYVCTLFNAIQ